MVAYKDKLVQMCRIFNRLVKYYSKFQKHTSRPQPLFETYKKEDKFYSKVRVGILAVFDQNSPGSGSVAESQDKAAYTWLTTFPNTWLESATSKAGSALGQSPLKDHALPCNLAGQLNSAEKKQSSGFAENSGDAPSSSGVQLKPLSMHAKKKVKAMNLVDEVTEQAVPNTCKVSNSPSSWAVVKLADFWKYNPSRKVFWESSFVLLVISAVEMCTLTCGEAAGMLGVDVWELETQVSRIKGKENKLNQKRLLSKEAQLQIKSEACKREFGNCEDNFEAIKEDQTRNFNQVDNIEERGVKRKVSSSAAWITGEVVTHLLRRSFSMKDQFFPLDGDKPLVFVLRMSWPFYESNVKRVVKEIDEYYRFTEPLMESHEVQKLLKAAQNLDSQKMEGGGYALAPAYNYSRCMLEKRADYWETGLPALLLQDVDNGMVTAEVAAYQLGVTTSMVLAAIAGLKSKDKFSSLWEFHSQHKGYDMQEDSDDEEDSDYKDDSADEEDSDNNDDNNRNQKKKESKKRATRTIVKKQKLSGPVTVQRYKECGFGSEEDFWKENTTKDVLEKVLVTSLTYNLLCLILSNLIFTHYTEITVTKVREREISVEMMAAEWGVSRAEIVRRCGAVKTDQELEGERKLRRLDKFEVKVQKAGFVKKESHLEKQIAQAEGCLDQLSEYEKMRLQNMKERQALLEQLEIGQDKKEIAEERQKSMIFTPKKEVERRAPSARVRAMNDQNSRMLEKQVKAQYQSIAKQMSPKWVGQWLPLRTGFRYSDDRMDLEDISMACSVPRGMLKFGDVEEQHRPLQTSQATVESIAAELKEITEEPPYAIHGAVRTSKVQKHGNTRLTEGGIFSELVIENESVVSSSAITSMGTCWDFAGFGTAEGGVGVHIGATHISWRPHNDEVTGIAFWGGSSDLSIISTSLDGAVRRSDLARQSVLLEYEEDDEGIDCLVKRNQSEFLLGCDSNVRLLDLRRKKVSTLLRQGGSGLSLHPTDPHLLAVGECIYDLRQPKETLLKLQGQVSSLQWNPSSGAQLLAVEKFIGYGYQIERHQVKVFSTEQLMRGEKGLLFTKRISDPLAAQWNPWYDSSLFLSGDPNQRDGLLR